MQRPKLPAPRVREILAGLGVSSPVAILGVRGYFRNGQGERGRNDRGIYDDAFFLVTPAAVFPFNGNTDPSVYRPGIATLRTGVYPYRKGKHGLSRPGGGYDALRPATPGEALPVTRDGVDHPEPGVAINIHKGGLHSTSSEGCQTIHPGQWPDFIRRAYRAMDAARATTLPYALVENDGSLA